MFQSQLSSLAATGLFVIAVLAGHRYRRVWKTGGPAWRAWLYGSIAGLCLLALGLIPIA